MKGKRKKDKAEAAADAVRWARWRAAEAKRPPLPTSELPLNPGGWRR